MDAEDGASASPHEKAAKIVAESRRLCLARDNRMPKWVYFQFPPNQRLIRRVSRESFPEAFTPFIWKPGKGWVTTEQKGGLE